MYIFFGAFSGIVGTVLSLAIRSELPPPAFRYFSDQLYNVLVTAQALIMTFFYDSTYKLSELIYINIPIFIVVLGLILLIILLGFISCFFSITCF